MQRQQQKNHALMTSCGLQLSEAFDPFGWKGALKDTVEGLMDPARWQIAACWRVRET